jgi:hypothetical protein
MDGPVTIDMGAGDEWTGSWSLKNDNVILTPAQSSEWDFPSATSFPFGFDGELSRLYVPSGPYRGCFSKVKGAVYALGEPSLRKPFVMGPRDTIVKVNDSLTFTALLNGDAAVSATFLWSKNGGTSYDTTPLNRIVFSFKAADIGDVLCAVKAIDNAGKIAVPVFFIVSVKTFAPMVQFHDSLFHLNDHAVLRATGEDENGAVKQYFWTLESDTPLTVSSVSDTIGWSFERIGTFRFSVVAVDDEGLKSAPSRGSVQIVPYTYGTTSHDCGVSIVQAADKGFLIAGNSGDEGLVVKADSGGGLQWRKIYDGFKFRFTQIAALADGGAAVAGTGGSSKAVLIVLDNAGNEQWNTSLGSGENESGNSLAVLPDGGFFLCGYSLGPDRTSAALLYRIDNKGNVLWRKTYKRSEYSEALKIIALSGGAAAMLGSTWDKTSSGASSCGFVMKLSAQGDSLWSTRLNDPSSQYRVQCIEQTPDTGFIIAGTYTPYGTGWSLIGLVKMTSAGSFPGIVTVGSQMSFTSVAIGQLSNGGFLLVGTDGGDYSPQTVSIRILDASAKQSDYRYFGPGCIKDCIACPDGGFVLTGQEADTTFSKHGAILLVKVDGNGKRIW